MLPSRAANRFAPRVEARNQVLTYRIPIVGTGFALHYASDRVPGRRAAYQLRIPLRGSTVPGDVEEIALEVAVGDRRVEERIPATEASHLFTWQPSIGDGVHLARTEAATVRVGQVHPAMWPRPERVGWREHRATVGVWDARSHGLGGWTLSPHHALDPVAGTVYLGDGGRRSVGLDSQAAASDTRRIPSESGHEVYVFSADGRHLHTVDGLLDLEYHAFGHDPEGRLEHVSLGGRGMCRIARDGGGAAVTVLGPGGARTGLRVDEAGYLRSVVDPAGATIEVRHDPDGLLREIVDPRGNAYRFGYDDLGRLISEEHPGGGGSVLRRTTNGTGFMVRRSTATGIELMYGVERLPDGTTKRVNGCCAGAGQTIAVQRADGHRMITYPDGSILEYDEQPDPHLGPPASLLKQLIRRAPSGLSGHATLSPEIVADPTDPPTLRSRTDRLQLNGRAVILHVDVAERRMSYTSAEGRQATITVDADGRSITREVPDLAPLRVECDEAGRLRAAISGERRISIEYDDRGRPTAIEDGAGRRADVDFDEADRPVRMVSAGSRRCSIAYDVGGNPTTLTAPSGAPHRFTYGPANRWTEYETPTGERYQADYDPDGRPALARLPSGREVRLEYDETGRLRAVRSPEAVVELRHDAGGHLASALRVPTDGDAPQGLVLAHDGPLVTDVSWEGPATGRVSYGYDRDFRLSSVALDGTVIRRLVRDGDGLVTAIGPFSVQRGGPAGRVSAINDERLEIAAEFDETGRTVDRVHRVSGREFYRLRLEYDRAGRILRCSEALAGRESTRSYAYDADGQLVGVDVDGSSRERYAYDANGNRVSHETSAGVVSARFDAADRLIALGGQARQMDVDGALRRRGSHGLAYGARGELLRAAHDDGTAIRYTYDGYGRLVARTDAYGTEQYLYDHVAPLPQLIASRSAGALTEYYFDPGGHLFALVRDGAWFYVACDPVGSPRVVVASDGEVVRILERDAFGMPSADSNPAFALSIGFAGGIVDPATGLVRFGCRDYDPEAGRWTTPDPAGFRAGDMNLYRYVWNDPVNLTDRAGTQEDSSSGGEEGPSGAGFEPSGRSLAEQLGFGGNQVDTSSWQDPATDGTVTEYPESPLTNLAGSEPKPRGDDWKRGWDWNKYTKKGRWWECQVSVGGTGLPTSPYAPDNPGADPGGAPPSESGPKGVNVKVRF